MPPTPALLTAGEARRQIQTADMPIAGSYGCVPTPSAVSEAMELVEVAAAILSGAGGWSLSVPDAA